MVQAVELAREGYPAPNPHVGCVIARDGKVVGAGFHLYAGGAHAEVAALAAAGEAARGSDVFVTLEPCNHHGRTGPCSQALIRAGVRKVWIGVADRNPAAAGGAEVLREAGIEVEFWPSELADMARWSLRQFLSSKLVVVGKIACTADGFSARLDGTSKWITGEAARDLGHSMRAELGAVLVGRQTVLRDEPQLTARIEGVANQPVRLVVDSESRIPAEHPFFAGGGRRLCLEPQHEFDVPLLARSPGAIVAAVGGLGCTGLMVEGGGQLLSAMFGELDQFEMFQSPDVWGEGHPALSPAARLSLSNEFEVARGAKVGRDFWTTYRRVGTRA